MAKAQNLHALVIFTKFAYSVKVASTPYWCTLSQKSTG